MSLSIGIVGLPNVGKSTLFNALTKKSVLAANYPFATIDPSVGVVAVPDERLSVLTVLSQSKKTIPAAIEFVDIAGLVKGASTGEGLGNKFLQNIKETDAIAHVVRIFEDENIIHVDGGINPLRDAQIIILELILADLQTIGSRLSSLQKDVKRGDKQAVFEEAALRKVATVLESERRAIHASLTAEEWHAIRSLQLLTKKPMLFVLNKKAGATNICDGNDPRYAELLSYIAQEQSAHVLVDARIEEDMKDLAREDKELFRVELGVHDDGINDLIKAGYTLLSLITYFTTGEDETRAWTIHEGDTAPKAGAAIHGDFEEKFIRAEVVHYTDLVGAGSMAAARERGAVRTEGKEYVVKDGDVIEFKI